MNCRTFSPNPRTRGKCYHHHHHDIQCLGIDTSMVVQHRRSTKQIFTLESTIILISTYLYTDTFIQKSYNILRPWTQAWSSNIVDSRNKVLLRQAHLKKKKLQTFLRSRNTSLVIKYYQSMIVFSLPLTETPFGLTSQSVSLRKGSTTSST